MIDSIGSTKEQKSVEIRYLDLQGLLGNFRIHLNTSTSIWILASNSSNDIVSYYTLFDYFIQNCLMIANLVRLVNLN